MLTNFRPKPLVAYEAMAIVLSRSNPGPLARLEQSRNALGKSRVLNHKKKAAASILAAPAIAG